MAYMRNKRGSGMNWAADLIKDGTFIGRVSYVQNADGAKLTIRDNDKKIITQKEHPQGISMDEIYSIAKAI